MLSTKPIPAEFPSIPVKTNIFIGKDEVVAGKPCSEFRSFEPYNGRMGGTWCSIGSSVLINRVKYNFAAGSADELTVAVQRLHTKLLCSVSAIERSFLENDRASELNPDLLERRRYDDTGTVWQKHHKVRITADKRGFVEIQIEQLIGEREAKECFEITRRVFDNFLDYKELPVPPRSVIEAGPHLEALAQ